MGRRHRGKRRLAYDNNFRVTTQTVNGSQSVAYGYDNDGLLTGTSLGNVTDGFAVNPYGEVTDYQAAYGGGSDFSVHYVRDALGRIIEKTEVTGGETHTYAYGYDLAGRLTHVWRDAALISEYTYDSNGNRLSHTTPSGTTAGTYDNQDRLLTYGDFTYTYTYTYTASGELRTKTNTARPRPPPTTTTSWGTSSM